MIYPQNPAKQSVPNVLVIGEFITKKRKRLLIGAGLILLLMGASYEITVRYLVGKGETLLRKAQGAELINSKERISARKRALKYGRIAHRLQPWSGDARLLMGRACLDLASSSIRVEKEGVPLSEALSYAYRGLYITENSNAYKSFSKILGINPYLFVAARIYYLQKDYNAEKITYYQAVKRDPSAPLAYYLLGRIELSEDRIKDGRWYLMKAASVSSPETNLYWRIQLMLSYVDYVDKDYKSASSRMEAVIQKLPKHSMAFYVNGLMLKAEGKYEAAKRMFERSLSKGAERGEYPARRIIPFSPEKQLSELKRRDNTNERD